jgi:predicted AlkP superfamily pyrophosphatase or phosphodiesterase
MIRAMAAIRRVATMPRALAALLLSASVSGACAPARAAAQADAGPRRQLLIVVDGLRPDYVTEALMPNLTAMGRRGVVFTRHHSVYPTVTRVNAASISTGAYPERHGLLGNSVFFPRVNSAAFLDTADRAALQRVAAAEGRLLTAPTLAESLQAAGRRLLVVSSGSAGSALLLNHTGAGGAILHAQFTEPPALAADLAARAPPPGESAPAGARDAFPVDVFLKVGLPRVDPAVTIMWLGALDATAHDRGIGDPETVATLGRVDREIRRVEDGLCAAGLLDRYTIWVTSDHGFSTYTGGIDLAGLLAPFARTLPDGTPHLVTSAGAIYLRGATGDREIAAVVAALQRQPGIGAIFTRAAQPGALDGAVPGTLSFDAVRWTHDRAAQILVSPDWSNDANRHGVRGTSRSNGTAGHGSTSPWDVHNTLIAAGPDVAAGATIDVPSANTDLAPTFLQLLGLTPPPSMQGRVLAEALAGRAAATPAVKVMTHTARSGDGRYTVTATFSLVGSAGADYRYFDEAKAIVMPSSGNGAGGGMP